MSRQDKATTERNAKILRGLVKQPDSKLCADCKHPRWASWNLGVFLCIRCSGIHRSMGTHISRVKSIDLDIWTPEQMESIQKWGNRRANLYWEAHLKQGHIPPDHKIESFIRSKYESRRWAMEGPPPSDPSVLDNLGQTSNEDATPLTDQPAAPSRPTHASSASLSAPRPSSPSVHASGMMRQTQPQPRQLLSAAVAGRTNINSAQAPTTASPPSTNVTPAPPQPAQDDFFSLDFHAPPIQKTTAPPAPPVKDVKHDILSLFSSAPAPPSAHAPSTTSNQSSNAFGQFSTAQTSWDAFGSTPAVQPQPQAQSTSMIGTNGTGAWGVSSGWSAPPTAPSNSIWGSTSTTTTTTATPQSTNHQLNVFNTTDIWASSTSAAGNTTTTNSFVSQTPAAPKKDDVFGDLWGNFK
ncbi:hypothetical protein F5I97DRAFT_1813264 [Phlebopus sp. FC_14]|nr:hypothetical protein F5I97DRAFT_1813264 [Phlebopus sp. FC_14]